MVIVGSKGIAGVGAGVVGLGIGAGLGAGIGAGVGWGISAGVVAGVGAGIGAGVVRASGRRFVHPTGLRAGAGAGAGVIGVGVGSRVRRGYVQASVQESEQASMWELEREYILQPWNSNTMSSYTIDETFTSNTNRTYRAANRKKRNRFYV
jgi:hypothetical protein